MTYRMALDIGANSIGWTLLTLSPEGSPIGILNIGVRVFPDGRDPQTLASLAAERRLARGMRRRRDRYVRRRTVLLNTLTRLNLMPEDQASRTSLATLDPYALRQEALTRRLEPFELGRAIFHLNQRRGFRSNRKTDRGNEDAGKIAPAAGRLNLEIERSGARTLGAWLHERHSRQQWVRARLIGAGKHAAYDFYPTRALIEQEFDTIWQAQSEWSPTLTPEMRETIRRIIFHQRDLKAPKIGKCWLEPTCERAAKALPSTQAFRIAQDLAHLKLQRTGEPDTSLTDEQRARLALRLNQGDDVTFKQIRKELALGPDISFNLESSANEKLNAADTARRLAGRRGPLAKLWPTLTLSQQDQITNAIVNADTEAETIAALVSLGLPQPLAETAEKITLPDGHAALSTTAILRVLPHLEAGLNYADAVIAAGYTHHSDDRDGVIQPSLPYYGEVLASRLGTGSGEPADPIETRFGKAPNPTVHVALNQLRQLVNALIQRHGHPTEIVVEVLRELNHSAFERKRIAKEQSDNKERRETWAREITEAGQRVNGRNLARMRLWTEQGCDPKERVCPYTGDRISIARLFSDEIEEDHLLPFAITLDDSFANRVLVMRSANRRKTNKTPHQAFHAGPEWSEIQQRASCLPASKAWRFAPDALERWRGENKDFLARHLTDSAYLARLARLYLRAICDPDKVWCVPGRLTALLRDALGLNSQTVLGKGGARKERTDHRHHAIDALTIGLIDRALLNRVSRAAGLAHAGGRRLLGDIGEPWPGFVQEAAAKIQAVAVSFKPDNAHSGKLHNDTAYGSIPAHGPKDPNVRHRVPIGSLAGWSGNDVRAAIDDPKLVTQITAALASAEKPPGQVAALSAIPHDVEGRTIRRVQVHERLKGVHPIKDRRNGQPYKHVKLDANHCAEFWHVPVHRTKKVRMVVVPMLQAAGDAEARRLCRQVPDRRPHPAARLLVRLHKGDALALDTGPARKLFRVVKFTQGKMTLAELHESGNLKVRDAAKDDGFKYLNATITRLTTGQARKVFIDPTGRVFDTGPLPW